MYVLAIDDDPDTLKLLAFVLHDAGYQFTSASDWASCIGAIEQVRPGLVLLEAQLRSGSGFELCRRLRGLSDVPLIFLAQRAEVEERVLGLSLGADDYVAKPFSTRVLLARVSALLRRNQARALSSPPAEAVTVGGLSLDADRMEARFKGVLLTLTLTEFRLLEAFARRPGIVLSRDRLLEIVRGDESVVVERIVDTYVKRIRRKLEAVDATFDGIETVIGAGYRLRG